MDKSKALTSSITFWSLVLVVAGPKLIDWGWQVPTDEASIKLLAEWSVEAVAAAGVIWGRWRARSRVTRII